MNLGRFQENSTRALMGLHRHSGQWTSLITPTGEVCERDVLVKLAQGTQPLLSEGYVRIEDFSAFRFENLVHFTFMK